MTISLLSVVASSGRGADGLAAQRPGDWQGQQARLVLEEVASLTLPQSFNLAGMSLGSDGSVLAWGREPNALLSLSSELELVSSTELPADIVPLAAWKGSGVTEVVTANPPTLNYVEPNGIVREAVPIHVDGLLVSAKRSEKGWYVLSESFKTGSVTAQLHGSPGDVAVKVYGAFTPERTGVWLTDVVYPFAIHEYNDGWAEGRVFRPPVELLDRLHATTDQVDFATWASLPMVPLDGFYVQTVADLATDRRLVVAYDESGDVVASLILDAPLGLMVSDHRHGYVYGARRTNRLEIVQYGYRWEPCIGNRLDHSRVIEESKGSCR